MVSRTVNLEVSLISDGLPSLASKYFAHQWSACLGRVNAQGDQAQAAGCEQNFVRVVNKRLKACSQNISCRSLQQKFEIEHFFSISVSEQRLTWFLPIQSCAFLRPWVLFARCKCRGSLARFRPCLSTRPWASSCRIDVWVQLLAQSFLETIKLENLVEN